MRTTEVADVLVRIVERRRERLEAAGVQEGAASHASGDRRVTLVEGTPGHGFVSALRGASGTAIIAEVKLGSPKLGDIRERVDPAAQARIYRDGGATALSVVVEPDYFYGSYDVLERCRRASGLPAIAKDFVVSVEQFRWARDAGAGAVLLIAALYEASELADYAAAALEMGLVPLIETHSARDASTLAECASTGVDFDLVGVNNRDLRTFQVDLDHSVSMLPRLPADALKVAESGIATRADIERLESVGFDGFLIGESLLLAEDPARQLALLLGNQR